MGQRSSIEWTDATWNPVTGCDPVSPGCAHCYAQSIATRFEGTAAFPEGFRVTLRHDKLTLPLRWRSPKRIFVNSMSDLFHDGVPDDYIERVFWTMSRASHHTFQLLTKRPARMAHLADRLPWPHNLWAGVSVENQRWADRVRTLGEVPASRRFVSAEPLLGPVELDLRAVDWVIVGGESGHRARAMKPDWARALRDACSAAHVAFFFKQWGSHDDRGRHVSKHSAGRMLDGREWNELPDG